jgi:hypothetical protein
MSYDHKPDSVSGAAAPIANPGRAPGKRSRTQDLPPKKEPTHHEMTGIDEVDLAESEATKPGNFLTSDERATLRGNIILVLGLVYAAMLAGFGRVRLEKMLKNEHFWNGFCEILFISTTGPLGGLIARTLSKYASQKGFELISDGFNATGKFVESFNEKKVEGISTLLFKGARTQLAHYNGGGLPKSEKDFIAGLEAAMGPAVVDVVESLHLLNDTERVVLYNTLKDPVMLDPGTYAAKGNELIEQFSEAKIGSIGNVMDFGGGYEVATVKKVKIRTGRGKEKVNREFVVLLESHGVHNSALALNGANMETDKPKKTMESLVFVRLLPQTMHDLAMKELGQKRGEGAVETLDFNDGSVRSQHRWFNEGMYDALKKEKDLDKYSARQGDDPYDFGMFSDAVSMGGTP